jgi:hypothetical protein
MMQPILVLLFHCIKLKQSSPTGVLAVDGLAAGEPVMRAVVLAGALVVVV